MNGAAAFFARVPAWAWAVLCGLSAALAFPPFGVVPGLLGYGGMMVLSERAGSLRGAFWRGWLAGTGFFAVSCWWVTHAFFVDAATFGWLAPIAVTALAGGLGLFWGAASTIYRLTRPAGALRVLVFAGILAGFEWIRGHILTGFPWNLPGEAWPAGGMLSQWASVFGAYGLSWITLVAAACIVLVVVNPMRRSSLISAGAALVLLAAMAGWGAWRLQAPPARFGPPVTVRIVQPDFPELAAYDGRILAERLQRYLAMSTAPAPAGMTPQLIFWPEGALPIYLDQMIGPDRPLGQAIAERLKDGQILIVGVVRTGQEGANHNYYNTLVAVRRNGVGLQLVGFYDKFRLVPFGEYTPGFLKATGLTRIIQTPGDFTVGPPPAPLDLGPITIQPLICYESLFPGFTRGGERRSGRRAQMIVNLTDDAWFGVTSGPLQHLNLASYRAVEEGLMLVRSTPSGVSAIVDARGRIAPDNRVGLRQPGVIDARVNSVQFDTLYRRFGDLSLAAMLVVSALALGVIRLGNRRGA